jgi:hypothetical protein
MANWEGDPFGILGLDRTADLDDVYAARRSLARIWHPDLGGDASQMALINDAVLRCEVLLRPSAPAAWEPAEDSFTDHPSFRVEALPALAHEALKIVGSWLGEVLVDDPPYLLECVFGDPVPCWCQFHLLPEAGSSMVGLRVAAIEGGEAPAVKRVRDEVIAALNELDWENLE